MRQPKSISIDGVLVIYNGYTIEYKLPTGYGGMQLMEYIEKNKNEIEKFRKLCDK